MMRKIKFITTVGVAGEVDTNARTFGELKPLISARNIDIYGMKLMVGETLNELSVDDAVLPEGDFKIYLTPAKTKSGSDRRQLLSRLDDIYNAIERLNSTVNEIYDEIENWSDAPAQTQNLSYEDQKDVEFAKRLAGGNTDPWA